MNHVIKARIALNNLESELVDAFQGDDLDERLDYLDEAKTHLAETQLLIHARKVE